jgi:potassium-transporting ATPase KdpC subunit
MKKFWKEFRPVLVSFLVMTVLCGVLYTGLVTGIAQTVFPEKANGSILTVKLKDGSTAEYGSALLAQEFSDAKYLIGRPSGTSNLSAVSSEEAALVQDRIDWLRSIDPNNKDDIPLDLVTASGSGADPYISPEAAQYQAARIARERGLGLADVQKIIDRYTTGKFLGIWGEEGVNVLKVNLALDGML